MSLLDPVTGITGAWTYVQDRGTEDGALTVTAALAVAAVVAIAYLAAYLIVIVGPFVLLWSPREVQWDRRAEIPTERPRSAGDADGPFQAPPSAP